MTISAPEHDSADDLNVSEDDLVSEVEDDEEEDESLGGRTWATLIAFAAFVVMTSGCMINLLLR